jgi:hypothetical protein
MATGFKAMAGVTERHQRSHDAARILRNNGHADLHQAEMKDMPHSITRTSIAIARTLTIITAFTIQRVIGYNV